MPVPLHEWETFYVIIGSGAAALTGLQFVVIALGADARRVGGEAEVAAFATPTVVHFCAVLTISAIVSIPGLSVRALSVCLTIGGVAGLAYAIVTAIRASRTTNYAPVFEDWLWHAGFPLVAYVTVLISGIVAYRHEEGAMYVVAATSLLLLFVGIHNAWDAAVYMSMHRRDEP